MYVTLTGTVESVTPAGDDAATVYLTVGSDSVQAYKLLLGDNGAKLLVGAEINVIGKKGTHSDIAQIGSGATFTVVTEAPEEMVAVKEAAENLVNPFAESYTEAMSGVTLTAAPEGMTISYASDNAAITVNGLEADVVLPTEGQVTVKVTATIVNGEYTATKEFTVKVGTPAVSAGAPMLYISEYYEGNGGNNKYIVLTNATDSVLDLTGYVVEEYSNENTTPNSSLDLGATFTEGLAANGTIFIYNSGTTLTEALAIKDASTLSIASSVCYFNGDDAVILTKDGLAIDTLGEVGGTDYGTDVRLTRTAAPTEAVTAYNASDWDAVAQPNKAFA